MLLSSSYLVAQIWVKMTLTALAIAHRESEDSEFTLVNLSKIINCNVLGKSFSIYTHYINCIFFYNLWLCSFTISRRRLQWYCPFIHFRSCTRSLQFRVFLFPHKICSSSSNFSNKKENIYIFFILYLTEF